MTHRSANTVHANGEYRHDRCCAHGELDSHDEQGDSHGDGHECCITGPSAVSRAGEACLDADGVPTGFSLSRLHIVQMDCPTEEALIRKMLGSMRVVRAMEFNLMQRVLSVVHQDGALPAVVTAIHDLGMSAKPMAAPPADGANAEATDKPWWPLALAGVIALGAEIAHWVALPEWLSALLALAAIALSGTGTYKKGWVALRHGNLNINALMSIAVTGAVLLQQWGEAAMVMVLFALAESIEAKSLDRARNAIRRLMQLTPEMATVKQPNGEWIDMLAGGVAVGQFVRIKPGERIALDGTVTSGQSSVKQAPITGESLPVEKSVGDKVFAGTINEAGSFEYQVTAVSSQSTLARIIRAVENAQGARAPTQRFVDRFARIYTPAVFAFAAVVALVPPLLLGGFWAEWGYRALVLLIIACPCALVISTPVTIVSGLAAAAHHGILIKGGIYLEEGHKLVCMVFDKTGTITHGRPVLTDTNLLDPPTGLDVVCIATNLAARSDHPVSRAIASAWRNDGKDLHDVSEFAAIPGRGVRGRVGGVTYHLGNHRLVHELGVCSSALEAQLSELEKRGKTVILLVNDERVLALFAVADTVRENSRSAIRALHELGIRTVMLSGDNAHTARSIADQAGIDEALGDQLPEDKLSAIEGYAQSGKVGMVGDGTNDAPALARADIGFAMGAAGTDTAIETADVALMDDDLNKIARFVRLSRKTRTVLIQNISLALGIKTAFLVLAALGMGTMWMAVFADMGASLLVVANGLRLVRQ